MARISEQVLAGLANPQFAQGMFNLGTAIGSVPGQMKQRRRDDEFNELMAQAQKAQQDKNEAQLFQIAQSLRALGRNKAADTVAATATNLREENRKKGLVSAVTSAQQIAREGGDIQPLIPDIQELGGTAEQIDQIRSIVRDEEMNQKEAILQQVLASPEFDITRPQDTADYFRGAAAMNVNRKVAREIYDNFVNKGDDRKVQSSRTLTYRDSKGNMFYDTRIQYKDGTSESKFEASQAAQASGITAPQGPLTLVSETTGAGAFDKADIEKAVTLETDFSELRVEALGRIGDLEIARDEIGRAIEILQSGEIQQGGVPTQVAKSLLRFIGTDKMPETYGEFEGLLTTAVMARLQGFEGAISEGERQFAIDSLNNYLDGNKVNIGRLSVILDNFERNLQKSINIARSDSFDDYRRSSGIFNDSDFFIVPKNERREAREAVESGVITYQDLKEMYRSGGR